MSSGLALGADDRYGAGAPVQPLQQPSAESRYGGQPPRANPAGQPSANVLTRDQPPAPMAGGQPPATAPAAALQPPPSMYGQSPGPRTNVAATSNGPASPPANNGGGPQTTDLGPTKLMGEMMIPPSESQLTGVSISLAEAVRTARTKDARSLRIDAYWDLCSSVADYYLGLREQKELGKLRQGVAPGNAAIRDAEQLMASRLDTSLKAAVASQLRLADLMGRPDKPLPSDPPFCGRYATRYQQIFGGRSSNEAAQLDRLIPLRSAELETAAAAVGRAEQWTLRVARQDSNSADGILQAMQLMALNRRAFVQIAKDYNRRIARYAELASPEGVAPETLISMLIETPEGPGRTSVAGRDPAPSLGQPAFRSPLVGPATGGLR
ncbi:hypothetical protein [Pirellulimonas nuda]|nr:hypothetical protein [Pirellulimonas nuda]